jgi:hypothetical protein
MLEIQNRTPFPALVVPALDGEGVEQAVVVLKATYALRGGGELAPAESQVPLALGDTHHGEPGSSSVRYASDLGPERPGTDVVLIGHAYALGAPVSTLDVDLRVGPLRKVVRVHGDRHYHRSISSWGISSPARFSKMPLIYERAFGGVDLSHPDPAHHQREARNDVGVGFVADKSTRPLEGAPLPNLEDPADLVRGPEHRPAPAGFGPPRARVRGDGAHQGCSDRGPRRARYGGDRAGRRSGDAHAPGRGALSPELSLHRLGAYRGDPVIARSRLH